MGSQGALRDEYDDRERAYAVRVIERWQNQGFDTLLCSSSGYCLPANSCVHHPTLSVAYSVIPLDSDEAISRVVSAIAAGALYRI